MGARIPLEKLLGKKYKRLTVIGEAPNQGARTAVTCQCDCGTIKTITVNTLRQGRSISCGCYQRQAVIQNNKANFREKLKGLRFGRLEIIAEEPSDGRRRMRCKCDCGGIKISRLKDLRKGDVKSCGCLFTETLIKRNTTHGKSDTDTYFIWQGILKRCLNKNAKNYKHYGARGIKVCKRWDVFENFLEDMGARKNINDSIERLDVNGNYEPKNCIWLDRKLQGWNTRKTVYIYVNEEKHNLRDASRILGISYGTLKSRYQSYLKKNPHKKHYKIRTNK